MLFSVFLCLYVYIIAQKSKREKDTAGSREGEQQQQQQHGSNGDKVKKEWKRKWKREAEKELELKWQKFDKITRNTVSTTEHQLKYRLISITNIKKKKQDSKNSAYNLATFCPPNYTIYHTIRSTWKCNEYCQMLTITILFSLRGGGEGDGTNVEEKKTSIKWNI